MRAFAITGIVTASWIPLIISGSDMRATPPSRRMSAGTRSSAITAVAPASSAIFACSGVTTSMITPPLSISARPDLTVKVASWRGVSPFSRMVTEFTRAVGCRAMSLEAVFVRNGERFTATDLGRGPWNPNALHGGAPAALLMHAFETCEPNPDLRIARVTYELVRPVPVGALSVAVRVTRPGRRVMLLEATIEDEGGTEVVRARALRIRPSEVGAAAAQPPPFPRPEDGAFNDFENAGLAMFATHGLEIRFVEG